MVVHIEENLILESETIKYLGMRINHNILWNSHIMKLKEKLLSGIGIPYKFRNKLNSETKMLLNKSLIHSHLSYLPAIYCGKITRQLICR